MRARTLGALLVVAGLLAGCGGSDVVAAGAAPPEVTVRPTSTAAAGVGIPPLSTRNLERVRHGYFHVQLVDPALENPRISAAGILKRRAKTKRPIEMALVRTTYEAEFLEDEMSPAKLAAARRKAEAEQNRLMWLLIFDKVTYAVSGPPGRGGPNSYVSGMAVFLDANTGEWVRGGNF